MDNEVATETLLFFIPLVAGSERIGSDLGSSRLLLERRKRLFSLVYLSRLAQ